MVKRRVCHIPKFSAWVTEKEIEWVGFWTRLSFTSSGKWSKGFYPNDVDSRVHNSWLSLHVAQVTWIIILKLFCKQTYFVSKFYYQISTYTMVVVLCSIKHIRLEFETVVLTWQEQPLPARLPSFTWLPFSCTLSSLTFLTFYSVWFLFFSILFPPFFLAFFLSKCPNILSTIH